MIEDSRFGWLRSITAILLVLLLHSFPAVSDGAPRENRILTLNECITIALQNNTSIRASEEDRNKALAEYRVAKSQRYGFVSFETRSNQYPKVTKLKDIDYLAQTLPSPGPSVYNWYKARREDQKTEISRYYNLGLSFGLIAGITIFNEQKNRMIDAAYSGVRLSRFQSAKTVQDVIYTVKKSYHTYHIAKNNIQLREKLLKGNQDRLKITEIFFKNGQKTSLDVSKARYDLSESQLELQKARNSERTARSDLFTALGIPEPQTEIELEPSVSIREIRYSIDELRKLGEQNFPDLQMIRTQKEINRIKIAVERGGHYPEVTLQGGIGYENGRLDLNEFGDTLVDKSNWKLSGSIGFTARIPLFSGGMVRARVDSARADYNKLVYKEREVLETMNSTIDTINSTLNDLVKQLDMARIMKENAEKHLLLAKKSYESGTATQLEMYEANASMVNAELGYQKAMFDYLMTMARLASIVGVGEDSLCAK